MNKAYHIDVYLLCEIFSKFVFLTQVSFKNQDT